ncbi:Lysophospholipase, alpha-beta hydrolase superfamily [Kaistia soli DSM 19436]|uniref:Lysophospholipase, alpha-beta hydrolase superfamily n=1 Tax=Kaistia soli DSM 19436 TaxID=1122133 RepID=A0A1M5GFY7_9HYPH|nr:alpha/beta hydrolase [Kaistia soli]SHG02655.1 Lysophospholipase, alpha-beta hydrolase superfamily [Kaistia soli DSM 19436]
MHRWFGRQVRRLVLLVIVVVVTLLGARIYLAESGPPLEPWHTFVPKEMSDEAMDRASFADYQKAENTIFADIRSQVTDKLEPAERVPFNRYFADSPVNPERFSTDWNRSFELMPTGTPVGAAVFLHGLTDSPYSLRHLAKLYQDRGFVAIGIRLPGHGTVPGGLTAVSWQDWMAAVRLAMREARSKAGPNAPIHIVGYSNGGALAMLYALDAQEDQALIRPARIVLMSPMIGVTRFARFSGLAGLPALLPAFAKTAWLDLLPEFNPFKYNSFPVNAAHQSYALTMAVQDRITRLAQDGKLGGLAPVLTLQSVLDATVSVQAVVNALYGNLPDNGSELVLFDINRHTELGLLFRTRAEDLLPALLTPAPRNYRLTVIGNREPTTDEVVARSTAAGSTEEAVQPTGLAYSPDIYSLSHVAMPFPPEDGLYGNHPDPADAFGIHLGTIAAHGERSALIVSLDWLLRISWNPFFPFVRERVLAGLPAAESAAPVVPSAATEGAPVSPAVPPQPPAAPSEPAPAAP